MVTPADRKSKDNTSPAAIMARFEGRRWGSWVLPASVAAAMLLINLVLWFALQNPLYLLIKYIGVDLLYLAISICLSLYYLNGRMKNRQLIDQLRLTLMRPEEILQFCWKGWLRRWLVCIAISEAIQMLILIPPILRAITLLSDDLWVYAIPIFPTAVWLHYETVRFVHMSLLVVTCGRSASSMVAAILVLAVIILVTSATCGISTLYFAPVFAPIVAAVFKRILASSMLVQIESSWVMEASLQSDSPDDLNLAHRELDPW